MSYPRQLPPELITHIALLAGRRVFVILHDLPALRLYLRHFANDLPSTEVQQLTDLCVEHRFSAGLDLLVTDANVTDPVSAWPTRGGPRLVRGHELVSNWNPSARPSIRAGFETPQRHYDLFYEHKRQQAAGLALQVDTVRRLWQRVDLHGAEHKHARDVMATLVLNAIPVNSDDDLMAWCCRQSLDLVPRLGRLIIERGGRVEDLRALCCRAGLCADDVSLATHFFAPAVRCGRTDLVHFFNAWCPHLACDKPELLNVAAESGSVHVVRFLLDKLYRMDPDDAFMTAVAAGYVDVARELADYGGVKLRQDHLVRAVECDQVDMLKWLLDTGLLLRHFANAAHLLDRAVKAGSLAAAEWIGTQWGARPTSASLRTAITHGRLHMAQWIHQQGVPVQDEVVMEFAITNGFLEIVQWLVDVDPMTCNPLQGVFDARRSQLPVSVEGLAAVQWACERSGFPYRLNERQVDLLVEKDQVERLRAFCEHWPRYITENHLRVAVARCSLELVCWVDGKIPGATYTSSMLDAAAARGSLALVKWIAERLSVTDEAPMHALDQAAKVGHLHIVRFLTETMPNIPATTRAMDDAAAGGHLDVVQYLHEHRTEGCTTKAMDAAAAGDHLAVLQYLHQHRSEGCTVRAMNAAAACGSLRVVQWLHEHRTEGCTGLAMHQAAANGWLHVVQYLHANRTEGCTPQTMNAVAAAGHLPVLAWFYATRGERCSDLALEAAAKCGHFPVVQFLCQYRTERVPNDMVDRCGQSPYTAAWLRKEYGYTAVSRKQLLWTTLFGSSASNLFPQ
ncbi:hypothetical protein RI367_005011 [Sorochytrium milnesiophthora]